MNRLIDILAGKDLGFWILVILLVAFLMWLVGYSVISGKPLREVGAEVTMLSNVLMLLVGYRYGSSKGSKDKDKTPPVV